MSMKVTFIIVPGYTNSGPEHWQSHIERKYQRVLRVQQDDWFSPKREPWMQRLNETIDSVEGPVFLIGHSCGAVTISQWAEKYHCDRITGALLVAPADVDSPDIPEDIIVQRPLAFQPLPFPTTVVCSDNDEFLSYRKARQLAESWGASLITLPGAGHLHTAAGFGEWPDGEALINRLSGQQLIARSDA